MEFGAATPTGWDTQSGRAGGDCLALSASDATVCKKMEESPVFL